jgi:hypothetical protein
MRARVSEVSSITGAGVRAGGVLIRQAHLGHESDRCCSDLSRRSCPNGGSWRYSRNPTTVPSPVKMFSFLVDP